MGLRPSKRLITSISNPIQYFPCYISSDGNDLGIPVKVNIDSGGKPNGIPERR